jgi:hypothetical protein
LTPSRVIRDCPERVTFGLPSRLGPTAPPTRHTPPAEEGNGTHYRDHNRER